MLLNGKQSSGVLSERSSVPLRRGKAQPVGPRLQPDGTQPLARPDRPPDTGGCRGGRGSANFEHHTESWCTVRCPPASPNPAVGSTSSRGTMETRQMVNQPRLVLLTGAAGRIGTCLRELLPAHGYRLRCFDRLPAPGKLAAIPA
ncbi:hypothetical protein ACFQ87_44420, partial [Kitasatospora sp. NPDC056531]